MALSSSENYRADIKALEKQIHKIADEAYPSIKARGGGYQRIAIKHPEQQFYLKSICLNKRCYGR